MKLNVATKANSTQSNFFVSNEWKHLLTTVDFKTTPSPNNKNYVIYSNNKKLLSEIYNSLPLKKILEHEHVATENKFVTLRPNLRKHDSSQLIYEPKVNSFKNQPKVNNLNYQPKVNNLNYQPKVNNAFDNYKFEQVINGTNLQVEGKYHNSRNYRTTARPYRYKNNNQLRGNRYKTNYNRNKIKKYKDSYEYDYDYQRYPSTKRPKGRRPTTNKYKGRRRPTTPSYYDYEDDFDFRNRGYGNKNRKKNGVRIKNKRPLFTRQDPQYSYSYEDNYSDEDYSYELSPRQGTSYNKTNKAMKVVQKLVF